METQWTQSRDDQSDTTVYRYDDGATVPDHGPRPVEGGDCIETVEYKCTKFRNSDPSALGASYPHAPAELSPCAECGGSGKVLLLISSQPCQRCGGRGSL